MLLTPILRSQTSTCRFRQYGSSRLIGTNGPLGLSFVGSGVPLPTGQSDLLHFLRRYRWCGADFRVC